MNTQTMCFSWLLRTVFMVGALFVALSYTSIVNAAQGCGQGFHRGPNGGCTVNHRGSWTVPGTYHNGCWLDRNGARRCYPR